MRRAVAGLVGMVAALVLVTPLHAPASPATPAPAVSATEVGDRSTGLALFNASIDLPGAVGGRTALRLLAHRLDDAADLNGLGTNELRAMLLDDPTSRLSASGLLHFQDPPSAAAPQTDPTRAARSEPSLSRSTLDETFQLHSNPGATKTIYIDVDGAEVSGTEWHRTHAALSTTHPAWDPASDGPAFSDQELAMVQLVWERVAEDYAPFDVDVTTEDPGAEAILRTAADDQRYGAHALVTPSAAALALCGWECSGTSFLNTFAGAYGPGGNGYGFAQPSWVFPTGSGGTVKGVAETVSHEVGHQLGLRHDGHTERAGEYAGNGVWAPIMGIGRHRPVTQWDQGSYPYSDNNQDDVVLLRRQLGVRSDEAQPGVAGAPTSPAGEAFITSRDDVDTFRIGRCAGPVTVSTEPGFGTGPNLDVGLSLRDAEGREVAAADPLSVAVDAATATGMAATVSATLTPGVYFASIDGVGRGDWESDGASPIGYDDYGSLGAYRLRVEGDCDDAGQPGAPAAISAAASTATSVTLAWSPPTSSGAAPVTGYVLRRTGSDEQVVVDGTTSSFTWSGLTPGTTYLFSISASNSFGAGPAATTELTTSVGTPPSSLRDLRGVRDDEYGLVFLSWVDPLSDGGHPVVGYEILVDGEYLGVLETDLPAAYIYGVPGGSHRFSVAAVNAVGGVGPATAVIVTEVPAPPRNDDFDAATPLVGPAGEWFGENFGATAEPDDPMPPAAGSGAGGASVWYRWTAPSTGRVEFDTLHEDRSRDTTLAAYSGSSLTDLVRLAGGDDKSGSNGLSDIRFNVVGGSSYIVVVDGYRGRPGGVGRFTLRWELHDPAEPTVTTLTSALADRTVTLTASATSASGRFPGTMSFYDGLRFVDSVPLEDGTAVLVLDDVVGGTHAYTARTWPDDTWEHASSASDPSTVSLPASETSAYVDAHSHGNDIEVRASVSSPHGTPVGSVTVYDGSSALGPPGPVALDADGRATVQLSDLEAGVHDLTVAFTPADDRYAPSRSVAERVTLLPFTTRTTVGVSVVEDEVRLETTVMALGTGDEAATRPDGEVRVWEGTRYVGLSAVAQGSATIILPSTRVGTHDYEVRFVPAEWGVYAPSSATASATVGASPTATGLEASVAGTSVTLRASVTAGRRPVAGRVRFSDGDRVVGSVDVEAGEAVLRLADTAAGTHSYRASFVPADDALLPSSSPTRLVSVKAPVVRTRTVLQAPRKVKVGARPTIRIVVSRGAVGAEGVVVLSFGDRSKRLVLRAGTASFRLPRLRAGNLRVRASYSSNATSIGSAASVTIQVRGKPHH